MQLYMLPISTKAEVHMALPLNVIAHFLTEHYVLQLSTSNLKTAPWIKRNISNIRDNLTHETDREPHQNETCLGPSSLSLNLI